MNRWLEKFLPEGFQLVPDIPDTLPTMSGLSGGDRRLLKEKNSKPFLSQEAFRNFYEERAAILEFEAGFSREEAERRVNLEMDQKYTLH